MPRMPSLKSRIKDILVSAPKRSAGAKEREAAKKAATQARTSKYRRK